MTYYCKVQFAHEIAEYFAGIVDRHYRDASAKNDYAPLDLDWNYYLDASRRGECVAVTLHKSREICGYSVFIITNDPNSKRVNEANNIGIFVEKAHRGRGSLFLVRKSGDILRALGAQQVNYLIKNKALARLLESSGYAPEYQMWSVPL